MSPYTISLHITFFLLIIPVSSYSQSTSYIESNPESKEQALPKQKGYFHLTEIGLLTGQDYAGENTHTPLTIQTINGYRLNPHWHGGIGIGLNRFEEITTLPVFISLRADMLKTKVTPFYHADIGYAFAWSSENNENGIFKEVKGGLMFHPGMGIKVHLGNTALHFAVGYLIQKNELEFNEFSSWPTFSSFIPANSTYLQERTFRRFSFRVGISF